MLFRMPARVKIDLATPVSSDSLYEEEYYGV